MESTPLSFIKPTAVAATKHLPTTRIPTASTWKKTAALSAGAAASKVRVKAVQAMTESSEKAAMVDELEKELEKEGCWEWREMDKCKGCGERGGVVELMECLEREAIMGEDEGKDPTDYNRRAHIFDKSSKMFQALKHHLPSS